MNENNLVCKNCNSTEVLQTIEGYICRNCGRSWKDDMESSKLTKPKEFKVNDYLSLKLEDNITNIYVKGRLFQQCKYLLLNIFVDEITSLDAIESIDEAVEKLDRLLEGASNKFVIPPETEFWGHCSNLQVWYENNYNTRLIHSNLAFPLLNKLVEVGDVKAKRVFKEEIVNRYIEGNEATQTYLMEEDYLTNLENDELKILVLELFEKEDSTGLVLPKLNYEEILILILPPLEYSFLQELQSLIDEKIQVYIDPRIMSSPSIVIEQKRISQIRMERQNIEELPKSIGNLTSLKILNLNYNQLKNLPEEISKITFLEELLLIENSIKELPKTIGKLTHLRYLDLTRNKLDSLPLSFAKLKRLKYLNLNFNKFQQIPKIIGKLESLRYLFYDYNQLKNLPDIFHELKNLRRIDLQGNKLKKIPKALLDLNSIKKISLSKEFLEDETINLLELIKKEYSLYADIDHLAKNGTNEKSEVEPLKILFGKYVFRFFYEWGGSTNIFWFGNDEAMIKYGSPTNLYNLPLSSDIIDKFRSLNMKWQEINMFFIKKEDYDIGSNLDVQVMRKEEEILKKETKNTFLRAIKQLGPNFQVKFQMKGYGLPYER